MAFFLCLVAAVLFLLGVIVPDVSTHAVSFWLMLGWSALALAFAFDLLPPFIEGYKGRRSKR